MSDKIVDFNLISKLNSIPRITFDDLSPDIQKQLSDLSRERKWIYCSFCKTVEGKTKMKQCGGCKDEWKGFATYYCNEKCQRQGWPLHKTWCSKLTSYTISKGVLVGLNVSRMEHVAKYLTRWSIGLQPVMKWVLQQIRHYYPKIDWSYNIIQITFRRNTGVKSSPIPKRIIVKPPTPDSVASIEAGCITVEYIFYERSPLLTLRKCGQFCLPCSECKPPMVQSEEMSWKCNQWPWIFATFSAMGLNNDGIASIKLKNFLREMMVFLQDPNHPLSKFTSKRTSGQANQFYLHSEDFEEWQSYVGRVIAY